jgi:tetratricopeptide (TPR) repeat protein
LIDARTDTHLWSETYDRELENIFDLQDEISEAIVGALKESLNIQLETAPKTITATNTEAHDAYLRGRYLVVQRTPTTIEAAVREFEKAITLDPDFALAHAELAIAISLLAAYGDLPTDESIARATPHAERALALDPNLAEAHAAMGFLLLHQIAYEEALVHFEQAIQFNPNYSIVYSWIASVLSRVGRYDEEFAAAETALRLNPLSIVASINYMALLIHRDRLEEAALELEKMASIHPVFYAYGKAELMAIGGKWANLVLGDLDALQINPESSRRALPNDLALLGLEREALSEFETINPEILHVLGRPKDAVLMAEKRVAANPLSVYYRRDLGLALAAAGDYVHARPLLEEMWQRCGGQVVREGLVEIGHAAALIAIRRDAGDEIGVDEILAAIKDNVRRYREAGYTNGTWYVSVDYEEGVAAYLAGEREQGLVLIAKAADGGFFILPNEAYLQTLYDDPGFAPIIARQEARQARERNRFLSIVCTNNPYADVWQPAEGTCERFATEGES